MNGHKFLRQRTNKNRVYWRCHRYKQFNCPARVTQNTTTNRLDLNTQPHNHPISSSHHGEFLEVSFKNLIIISHVFRKFNVEDLLSRRAHSWTIGDPVFCKSNREINKIKNTVLRKLKKRENKNFIQYSHGLGLSRSFNFIL